MTIDADGNLWVAVFGGGGVSILAACGDGFPIALKLISGIDN